MEGEEGREGTETEAGALDQQHTVTTAKKTYACI